MIETTMLYWDCDCQSNYIHSSDEKKCNVCNYDREAGADARVLEVQAQGLDLAKVACTYCGVVTYSQTNGDGCHSCLKGTMSEN